jgi:hypothetical protein
VLLAGTMSCSRQTLTIRGTPAQIDQIITKLDAIDQRLAQQLDLADKVFFVVGLVLPFILPLIWLWLRHSYMSVGRRCLWGAVVPVVVALIIGLIFALWPAAWKSVGVDPLYVKVVDATTNPALKSVLNSEQTQNVMAMRKRAKGDYVLGRKGNFILEGPVLMLLSIISSAILGAVVAFILYKVLPNIHTAARRYRSKTAARA